MNKTLFNADAAEEYFADLAVFYKNTANEIFKRDNECRHASEQLYSAEYQKYVGMQIAMRAVLEYFGNFKLIPDSEPVWRDAENDPPTEPDERVLAIVNGRPHSNLELRDCYQIAIYDESDGWIIEEYPEWTGASVKWWMPLPEQPESVCGPSGRPAPTKGAEVGDE